MESLELRRNRGAARCLRNGRRLTDEGLISADEKERCTN